MTLYMGKLTRFGGSKKRKSRSKEETKPTVQPIRRDSFKVRDSGLQGYEEDEAGKTPHPGAGTTPQPGSDMTFQPGEECPPQQTSPRISVGATHQKVEVPPKLKDLVYGTTSEEHTTGSGASRPDTTDVPPNTPAKEGVLDTGNTALDFFFDKTDPQMVGIEDDEKTPKNSSDEDATEPGDGMLTPTPGDGMLTPTNEDKDTDSPHSDGVQGSSDMSVNVAAIVRDLEDQGFLADIPEEAEELEDVKEALQSFDDILASETTSSERSYGSGKSSKSGKQKKLPKSKLQSILAFMRPRPIQQLL